MGTDVNDNDEFVPAEEDPFFWLPPNHEWNACIGRQGHEENYLDGYIEAAIELAEAVLAKGMHDKRDTLFLPILYSARHAIELLLKFAIDKLHRANVIRDLHPVNHDILSHLIHIEDAEIGDALIKECLRGLRPFIESLSRIDEDGQELRYSITTDGKKSMEDRSLANLVTIYSSLKKVEKMMTQLKYRLVDFASERATGTHTAECSRRDLFDIARMLPQQPDWNSAPFDVAKEAIKTKYALSGKAFSRAFEAIKAHRELGSLVGRITPLAYLSDEHAEFVIEQWLMRHPPPKKAASLGTDYFADRDRAAERKQFELSRKVTTNIIAELSAQELADVEAIFYICRDRLFSELYEDEVSKTFDEHVRDGDIDRSVDHVMEKANFGTLFPAGVSMLGRPDLAEKLLRVQNRTG